MKILFIISTLRAGGAERVASLISSRFATDFKVTLLCFEDKTPFYKLNPKINLINIKCSAKTSCFLGRLKGRFSKIYAIHNLIKNEKFDLVISFMDSTNILVLLATVFLKVKVIISEHSYYKFLGLKWRTLKRLVYPLASALTVLTREDLDYYKFVKTREIVYNPMFFEEKNTDYIKQNSIIFVGRLVWVKGCELFLNSLNLIKDDLKDWEITIIGDGSDITRLKNIAIEQGLQVNFKGSVDDISHYYKRAKILVSSSFYEGLSNVLIEAIFYDTLRVSTPTSGAKELIKDGYDGILSADFSPKSLAKKIKIALNYDIKIVENAKKRKGEFDLENIYKKWLNLAKEINK